MASGMQLFFLLLGVTVDNMLAFSMLEESTLYAGGMASCSTFEVGSLSNNLFSTFGHVIFLFWLQENDKEHAISFAICSCFKRYQSSKP